MVSILNFVVTFAIILASLIVIRYFVYETITIEIEGIMDRIFRVVACMLSIASILWLIMFIWLVHIGFIRMKIFLWVRETYFIVQEGRLLELLLS